MPTHTPSERRKRRSGARGKRKFLAGIKEGGLHESLGIPEDQKIPLAKKRAAAKRPGLVGKQGRLALAFLKFKKRKK